VDTLVFYDEPNNQLKLAFILTNVIKQLLRWKLRLYSTNETYGVANTTEYPFGQQRWTIFNDPCYDEREITVTLNMNACENTEFNCANGHCIDIDKRCDGKIDCEDKTGTDCQVIYTQLNAICR